MDFNFKGFFRYNYLSFFKSKGTHYRLTWKRFWSLFLFLLLYIPYELITWFFFLLDEIFYPAYRKQTVKQPIFIIGNPRSGTTFLHRLMDKDPGHFSTVKSYELILAPSITQRKILWGLKRIDQLFGFPVQKLVEFLNNQIFKKNAAHKIVLREAEEDDHFLIHIWAGTLFWLMYPIVDESLKLFYFDQQLPHEARLKIMNFYKRCIQRHLYAHGGNLTLLSKNPAFTSRVATLREIFPDARFIVLVRTPSESMPSMMNYMAEGWKLFLDAHEPYPYKDEFFGVMKHFYLYPIEYFGDDESVCQFIKYDELVAHPDEIVEDLYDWLGIPVSEQFEDILEAETTKARAYKSKHKYSIEEMGLTEEQIYSAYSEVFDFYEFETYDYELPEKKMWARRGWKQNWKNRRSLRRERRLARRKLRQDERKQRRNAHRKVNIARKIVTSIRRKRGKTRA
ncbi:MAG: sulfotransferase [Anaerolineaceae bacterium]|nr:sulfotransferase [Anaerolineaceae bacterium]